MTLALISLGGASLLELWLIVLRGGALRRSIAFIAALLLLFGSVLLLIVHPAVWTSLLLFFSCYRLINLLRTIRPRRRDEYVMRVSRRSGCWLMAIQLLVIASVLLVDGIHIDDWGLWYGYVIVQLLVVLLLFITTDAHIRRATRLRPTETKANRDLPTVSVLVPARNETDDLDACLTALIGSSYPKLEILVLDDCSQNSRTPEIIRGFAHDGVRFVAGLVPPEQWLAKNYAYEQLIEQANGEILLFCGVDTRFQPESIGQIVATMLATNNSMLSIVPTNSLHTLPLFRSVLVQPWRYAWELALPRRIFHRPAVLSTCWAIRTAPLYAAGTFKAVCRSVSPERYFADYCAKVPNGYTFLRSQDAGIVSAKQFGEQRATAIRTRYPQLHQRLELTAMVTLIEASCFVLPFPLCIGMLIAGSSTILLTAAGLTCFLLVLFFARTVAFTYNRVLIRGFLLELCAAVYDIGLLNYSLWQYEFGEVIWKGRNICLPVLRALPGLPKLP